MAPICFSDKQALPTCCLVPLTPAAESSQSKGSNNAFQLYSKNFENMNHDCFFLSIYTFGESILYSAFTLVPSLYLEEKEIFILSLPQTYGGRADWDGKNRRDCLKFITF